MSRKLVFKRIPAARAGSSAKDVPPVHPWKRAARVPGCYFLFVSSIPPPCYMVKSNRAPLPSSRAFAGWLLPAFICSINFSADSAFTSLFSFKASSSFFSARFSAICFCTLDALHLLHMLPDGFLIIYNRYIQNPSPQIHIGVHLLYRQKFSAFRADGTKRPLLGNERKNPLCSHIRR